MLRLLLAVTAALIFLSTGITIFASHHQSGSDTVRSVQQDQNEPQLSQSAPPPAETVVSDLAVTPGFIQSGHSFRVEKDSSLEVSWTIPLNTTGIKGYELEYTPILSAGTVDWLGLATQTVQISAAGTSSQIVRSLVPDKGYAFRIRLDGTANNTLEYVFSDLLVGFTDPLPVLGWDEGTLAVREGDTLAGVVTLDAALADESTSRIDFQVDVFSSDDDTANGTREASTAGSDYVGGQSTNASSISNGVYEQGRSVGQISWDTTEDEVVEPDETFSVSLSQSSGRLHQISEAVQRVTIVDDDTATLSVSAPAGAMFSEDREDQRRVPITISLDKPVAAPVAVDWRLVGVTGPAFDQIDFVEGLEGTVVFPPMSQQRYLRLLMADDEIKESGGSVRVELSNPRTTLRRENHIGGLPPVVIAAVDPVQIDPTPMTAIPVVASDPGGTPKIKGLRAKLGNDFTPPSGAIDSVTLNWSLSTGLAAEDYTHYELHRTFPEYLAEGGQEGETFEIAFVIDGGIRTAVTDAVPPTQNRGNRVFPFTYRIRPKVEPAEPVDPADPPAPELPWSEPVTIAVDYQYLIEWEQPQVAGREGDNLLFRTKSEHAVYSVGDFTFESFADTEDTATGSASNTDPGSDFVVGSTTWNNDIRNGGFGEELSVANTEDEVVEGDETFSIRFGSVTPTDYAVSTQVLQAIIVDDDTAEIQITKSAGTDTPLLESDTSQNTVSLRIGLSKQVAAPVMVDYRILTTYLDDDADRVDADDLDQPLTGTVELPAMSTDPLSLSFTLTDDDVVEPAELLVVEFYNPRTTLLRADHTDANGNLIQAVPAVTLSSVSSFIFAVAATTDDTGDSDTGSQPTGVSGWAGWWQRGLEEARPPVDSHRLVTLDWTPPQPVSGETFSGYELQRIEAPDPGITVDWTAAVSETVGFATSFFSVSGLESDTSYVFRVRATTESGTEMGWSEPALVATAADVPTLGWEQTEVAVREGERFELETISEGGRFSSRLNGPADFGVRAYSGPDDTAQGGAITSTTHLDFLTGTETLTWEGVDRQALGWDTADDELVEPDETFSFALTADTGPTGSLAVSEQVVTVTIVDDDTAQVSLGGENQTISEDSASTRSAIFPVLLDKLTYAPVVVDWEIAPHTGSQLTPADFVSGLSGQLVIPALSPQAELVVTLADDTVRELSGQFDLTLTKAWSPLVRSDRWVGIPRTLQRAAEPVQLGTSVTQSVAVQSSDLASTSFVGGLWGHPGSPDQPAHDSYNSVSLHWGASAVTAAGFGGFEVEYMPHPGSSTLDWSSSASIPLSDLAQRSVTVTGLTAATDYLFRVRAVAIGATTSTFSEPLAISTTETVEVGFIEETLLLGEGATGELLLELSGVRSQPVTVSVRSVIGNTNGSANEQDFIAIEEVVTFPTGTKQGRVGVWTNDDDLPEGLETFSIEIVSGSVSGASLGVSSSATVQIADDETPTTMAVGPILKEGLGFLPPQIIEVSGSGWEPLVLDLDQFFTDPDSSTISYSAVSADIDLVTVSPPAGSSLTLSGMSKGVTTVEVTATDADDPGLSPARSEFYVTVLDRPPTKIADPDEVQIQIGQTHVLSDLSIFFTDPDGDTFRYEATSSHSDILAIISESRTSLQIALDLPAAIGDSAIITINPIGHESVTVTFRVRVVNPHRRPKLRTGFSSLPHQTLVVSGSGEDWDPLVIDLNTYFMDPDCDIDNDPNCMINYDTVSRDTDLLTEDLDGSTLILTGRRQGTVTVTVAATDGVDPRYGTSIEIFRVTIPDRPPFKRSDPPPLSAEVGSRHTVANLSSFFSDPDGDDLPAISWEDSGEGLVRVRVTSDSLEIEVLPTAVPGDTTTISIFLTNHPTVKASFVLTVTSPLSPPPSIVGGGNGGSGTNSPTTSPSNPQPMTPPSSVSSSSLPTSSLPTSPPASPPPAQPSVSPSSQPTVTQPSTPSSTQPNTAQPPAGGSGGGANLGGTTGAVFPRGGVIGDEATPNTTMSTTGRFSDAVGTTHEANILRLAESGITRGCNPPTNSRFCPERVVTRGEMATFLVRVFELPESSSDLFSDDDGTTHEANINALAAAEITRGCNPPVNSRYCPERPVTRGQMATFLARVMELTEGLGGFEDTINSSHTNDINRIATVGITLGCNPPANTRFCPDRAVTRGEMATFLVRAQDHPSS